MPALDQLIELTAADIAEAIGHARKAELITGVLRGVAAIGEPLLRAAPYAAARDALLDIPGIGPFSATLILLRGLGRMDELPAMAWLEEPARAVYGAAYDLAAIERRYGAHIGYWSFYLKARIAAGGAPRGSGRDRLGAPATPRRVRASAAPAAIAAR
jgi:DNA-3-methyladenine glycosylase II